MPWPRPRQSPAAPRATRPGRPRAGSAAGRRPCLLRPPQPAPPANHASHRRALHAPRMQCTCCVTPSLWHHPAHSCAHAWHRQERSPSCRATSPFHRTTPAGSPLGRAAFLSVRGEDLDRVRMPPMYARLYPQLRGLQCLLLRWPAPLARLLLAPCAEPFGADSASTSCHCGAQKAQPCSSAAG
jgi:hypothetical protein